MEYKRLTDKDITKVCFDTWELCGLDNVCKRDCREPEPCKIPQIIHRLAELEDKIENGTLVESPCKVGDIIYNKNIKFYLNHKEIPFEKLSELPQMTTDRENHTITEIVLHYIDKDAIFFYTKTVHYTVADGADPEKPTFEGDGYDDSVPNAATPVDFVEVVRCKDCRFYSKAGHCGVLGFCEQNEFCSRGEKKK